MAKSTTPDLNAVRKHKERKEQMKPYLGIIDDKYKKDDYDWSKMPDAAFGAMLTKLQEQAKPKEEKYSKEQVEAIVKERLGDVDSMVENKLQTILKAFEAGQSSNVTPQEVIREVTKDIDKKQEAIQSFNALFDKYGVGRETLVFKTIPNKSASMKNQTVKVKSVISKDGVVLELLATPSSESPFRAEQPADIAQWRPVIQPIFLSSNTPTDKYGKIVVGKNNPGLQKYLLIHPYFGKRFTIEDKKAEAAARKAAIKMVANLRAKIEEVDETREMRVMAVNIVGPEQAYLRSYEELYTDLNDMLDRDANQYRTLTEDKNNPFKYAYIEFQKKGFIKSTGMRMTIGSQVFYDGKKDSGSPIDSFVRWAHANGSTFDSIRAEIED